MRAMIKTTIKKGILAFLAFCCLLIPLPVYGAEGYEDVAKSSETAGSKDILQYGMLPVYGRDVQDGTYDIEVKSSSSFFRIQEARLTVKGGKMSAVLQLYSESYEYVYPGSSAEAAGAPLEDYISFQETDTGSQFTLPVETLDAEIPCAAFSVRRKKWYDRTLVFYASSLPADALKITLPDYDLIEKALEDSGLTEQAEEELQETQEAVNSNSSSSHAQTQSSPPEWVSSGSTDTSSRESISSTSADTTSGKSISSREEAFALASDDAMPVDRPDGEYSIDVDLAGGSGRASISSPTLLIVHGGKAYAKLLWSSTYYDWMKVGNHTYLNNSTDGGNSTFVIPVSAMDEAIPVIADTTSMGDPVAIDYVLTFYSENIGNKGQIPQEAAKKVIIAAVLIIVAGGILNLLVKRKRHG